MASRTRTRGTLLGLLALTALLYRPSLTHGYTYEDENWLPSLGQPRTMQIPGRQLTYWTHDITWRLTGRDATLPHAVNLLLHLVNGVVLYAVLTHLAPALALATAAVFLLHPLSSSAVLYLSGRTDLLMTTGILVALWGALGRPTWWRWSLGLAGLLGAAASKEVGLVGVGLLGLTLGCWHRWPSMSRMAASRALTGLLGAGAMALGVAIGAAWRPVWSWATMNSPSVGGASLPWTESTLLQLGALWHLVWLVVWPVGLSIDHDALAVSPLALRGAVVLTGLALGVACGVWRTVPCVAWGVLWVAIALLPRFVVRTSEFVTEPQMYLPMVGISVIFGAALTWLWSPGPSVLERSA